MKPQLSFYERFHCFGLAGGVWVSWTLVAICHDTLKPAMTGRGTMVVGYNMTRNRCDVLQLAVQAI